MTNHGYELIDGYDGYNDNATRSFSFGYAIPFTHTGLKAAYAFSDQLTAMLMLVNGWDNAKDNNSSKSAGRPACLDAFEGRHGHSPTTWSERSGATRTATPATWST